MLYATCCWLLVQNCYMQLLPVVQCNVLIALYEYWLSATSAMGSKNCSNNQQGMFVSQSRLMHEYGVASPRAILA